MGDYLQIRRGRGGAAIRYVQLVSAIQRSARIKLIPGIVTLGIVGEQVKLMLEEHTRSVGWEFTQLYTIAEPQIAFNAEFCL